MQPSLFDESDDLRALSHADDPPTSAEAIDALDACGLRAAHMRIVLAAVAARPGLTACELMRHTGLEEYQVRRRLTDLKNDGLVVRGDARRCKVKGTSMVTWRRAESVTGA